VAAGFPGGPARHADDAISVYDDLLVRFGTATELAMREQVPWFISHSVNRDRE